MKKLLFISSRPLFPIVGGDQIRTVQQLDLLKERFIVDVIYMTPNDDDESENNKIDGVRNIYRFKIGKITSILQTLRFIFNKLPLQVNYYYNTKVQQTIDSLIGNYNYVFCNNIRTAEYVRGKIGIVKLLDFVDAISMNYDKARHKAYGIKRLIYEIDYRRCRHYEQECLDMFDSCAVISDVDNKYMRECQR